MLVLFSARHRPRSPGHPHLFSCPLPPFDFFSSTEAEGEPEPGFVAPTILLVKFPLEGSSVSDRRGGARSRQSDNHEQQLIECRGRRVALA